LEDLKDLLHYPGAIRLVKGAFQEPDNTYIPRSEKLNSRYLELVDLCVEANKQVSIASHDETIHKQVIERGYLQNSYVEAELLYGIRPDLSKELKDEGRPVRSYLTYGSEWYLYLTHRIAEYPPNIYVAITDIIMDAESPLRLYDTNRHSGSGNESDSFMNRNKMSGEVHMKENHFEQMAKRYDTEDRIALAKVITKEVKFELQNSKSKSLLDYGSGTGLISLELSDLVDS